MILTEEDKLTKNINEKSKRLCIGRSIKGNYHSEDIINMMKIVLKRDLQNLINKHKTNIVGYDHNLFFRIYEDVKYEVTRYEIWEEGKY